MDTRSNTEKQSKMEKLHRDMAQRGLVRSNEGKVVAGVCRGLADTWHANVWAVRALMLVLIVGPRFGIVAYLVAWILMPSSRRAAEVFGPRRDLVAPTGPAWTDRPIFTAAGGAHPVQAPSAPTYLDPSPRGDAEQRAQYPVS